VVAVEHMHCSAGPGGLTGQPIEQIEDLELITAPVYLITGLYHDQTSADPVIVIIDGAGDCERPAGGGEVSVEIADRDDPLCSREARREWTARFFGCPGAGRQQECKAERRPDQTLCS